MAVNAPATSPQGVARDDMRPAAPGDGVLPARRGWFSRRQERELRIYQHSNLIYWWAVSAYGYFCAAVTYFGGIGIKQLAASDDKEILFHASPWLGISFIAVTMYVIVFTNVRARGVYSFVLLLLAGAVIYGTSRIPGIDLAKNWAGLLRIHLNLGFYLAFSSVLALLWVFVIVLIDHFTWWRFSPGQVIEEHLVGHATGHAYNTEGMVVRRLPDDFFRHRILGLGLIGLGTGDFVVRPANDQPFEIHNVWRASRKQRRMEDMIAMRVMETTAARRR